MRLTYDEDADAAYLYVAEGIPSSGVSKTYACDPREIEGMINLDFDSEGRLLGIEILDASTLLPSEALRVSIPRGKTSDG